ncbi:MAG: ISL3 family transposase [Acidobacteria bacterium]|nr:ISL3 family transposase [Acidobacteriota bacterium]
MKTLLASPQLLKLEKIIQQADLITLVMSSKRDSAQSPSCQMVSSKIHSHYERTVADLPWEGIKVKLRLRVRKFFCRNSSCKQCIFCERLPEVVARYAHRTQRLNEALSLIGFALGGRAGARTAKKLGLQTAADSILRRVHAAATLPAERLNVRVLGVDNWALKKGQHYGTILVDLEKRQPIDLLLGRESAPLEEWLKQHPEVEIITRDRAGAYADGARQGAPQAQQVADRWHLLKNANDAFERLLQKHQKVIREAVEQIPAPLEATASDEAADSHVVPATAREYVRSRAEQEQRQRFHHERKARYDRVQELKRQGHTIIQIKQHLGWSYSLVAGFFRADEYPILRRRKGRSCLDKFDAYLRERWNAGCHNDQQLYRELVEQGYGGSKLTVRRHVQLWRQQGLKPLPPAPKKLSVPGPRSCVWLLLKDEQKLTEEEGQVRKAILEASPTIKQGLELVQLFRAAISSRSEEKLVAWMETAAKSELQEFENFVMVLRRDEAAVRAAASSDWSNGQTEGQVNRLKTLKRQMYGRAKFDLLRARVLNAT